MTKLNYDSELYTSHCRQWWPIEVSKSWRLSRSGRSRANQDGVGAMTVEVMAGMVGVGRGGGIRSRGEGGKAAGMV
jgi:hypothetical protein